MMKIKTRWYLYLSIVCLFLLLTGCALTACRTHPEFDARIRTIQDPVLIPPDIRMYQLSPGGLIMLRDDWSAVGRQNLQKAILRSFKGKKCNVTPLIMNTQIAAQMAEVQALYRLVNKSMQRHTFGPHQITDETHGFKYSLGSIEMVLRKLGADSMIFVSGYDRVSSGGRKALIDLAIADASGTILYYSVKGSRQGNDLRDPQSAAVLVQDLLTGFSKAEG